MNQVIDTILSTLPPLRKNLRGEFKRLFGPQINYPYFCKRAGLPYNFQCDADSFEMVNAAWMADAALLAYVPNPADKKGKFDFESLGKVGWTPRFVKEKLEVANQVTDQKADQEKARQGHENLLSYRGPNDRTVSTHSLNTCSKVPSSGLGNRLHGA